MKYLLSLLSLSLVLCLASANASISSTCTIAKWKAMDALYTPSDKTLQARIENIKTSTQVEYVRLSAQFLNNDGSIKDVADLVAPYKTARYPYMLCVDYMFRAQKECDTQIQYLEYATTVDNTVLSQIENFVLLRNTLKQACITVGTTDGFKKDLAKKEYDIRNGW